MVVCLEEKGSDKKQVTFKWFKNYQDISPAKVKWLTSTGLGIVKVQLEEDEDGKEELFVPSEEVFRGNSVITVVKPASNKEHKFDGSNCQIQSKEKDWGVNCT
ncbi:hypothetical protein OVS_03215 [Mycoplasma ovis str. Michigan]|uniref:Ig-like domain-containing protein n=1 Tax=Mycoplasma ovis str. Michigan TaxID=1415773 RepID=A0ABM5P1Q8_9MOLU|nr:hypothetical protein [Mycoplasma ovis]AHC40396.1 hypothetical protein OVS_03215 [Mycoplasma ovis str. Michigan]